MLRKGQKELVETYREGKCAVSAIPGGGKTFALSRWAADMIVGTPDEKFKILIVTYMNAAANNMKNKISAMLADNGNYAATRIETCTIHSLCLQILTEGCRFGETDEEFVVIDDYQKSEVIAFLTGKAVDKYRFELLQICEEGKFADDNEKSDYIKKNLVYPALAVVGQMRMYGYNKESENPLEKVYGEVYEEYIRYLEVNGMIDFDRMVTDAYNLLYENTELREKYQKAYKYVCEDEAQDSNPVQTDILSLISNGNFLRIGDPNQSICGSFTNSNMGCFNEFCKSEETILHTIDESGRSAERIIKLANAFVKAIITGHPIKACRASLIPQYIKPVRQGCTPANPVVKHFGLTAAVFEDFISEKKYIIEKAGNYVKSFPNSTAAVIVSTNKDVDDIFNEMTEKGIACEKLGSPSQKIMGTIRLLGLLFGYRADVLNKAHRNELADLIESYKIKDILVIIEEIPLIPYERSLLDIAEYLRFDDEQMAIASFAAARVSFHLSRGTKRIMEVLVNEMLAGRGPFIRFAVQLREIDGYEPQKGVVTVSTYHKAKGLEWDMVILGTVSDYEFPTDLRRRFKGECYKLKPKYRNITAAVKESIMQKSGSPIDDNAGYLTESRIEVMSEKVRLLYVGITRACKYCIITGCEPESNGVRRESRMLRIVGGIIAEIKKEAEGK